LADFITSTSESRFSVHTAVLARDLLDEADRALRLDPTGRDADDAHALGEGCAFELQQRSVQGGQPDA